MQLSENQLNNQLLEATIGGTVEVVAQLIKDGAKIDYQTESGDTPLTCAMRCENTKVAYYLLKQGAKTELTLDPESIAITMALADETLDFAEYLIKEGANLNLTDNEGKTLLDISLEAASGSGDVKYFYLADFLRINGAITVNKPLKEMEKSLLENAGDGNLNNVMNLLRYNTNPNVADQENKTPLYWAVENKHLDVVNCLLNHGAIVTPEIMQMAASQNGSMSYTIESSYRSPDDATYADYDDFTYPFYHFSSNISNDITVTNELPHESTAYLLEKGANINTLTYTADTKSVNVNSNNNDVTQPFYSKDKNTASTIEMTPKNQ